ncbi:unnamed protein product [Chironomus riparius]|uniref:CCHC-type domain-containing protein n=1 Tax=Chironomus riparius TaxID=315576 RepID=A0A9N9RVZ1_9DIPT|nr:unnamed protein product [Chironomus riparius]
MSESEEENSRLDISVICVSEMQVNKQPYCSNDVCKRKEVFPLNDLIVKCIHCQGCYHPQCAGIEEFEHWQKFMMSIKNREDWKFVCEFCKKEIHLIVRTKELVKSLIDSVCNNHSLTFGKVLTTAAKVEKLELNHENVEKSLIGISDKLTVINGKVDLLPEEQQKIEKSIGEFCVNNAFYTSKVTDCNERSKTIESKVDKINFIAKKYQDEEWKTVTNKKKNRPLFSVVLKTNPQNNVGTLKEEMLKNYVPNEVNVAKIINAGDDKLIAVCENENEQQKFAEVAKKKYGNICEITVPDKKNRRFKVLNVEIWSNFDDLLNESIEEVVKQENIYLDQAKTCKVIKFMKARISGKQVDTKIHFIVEVDEKSYDLAMSKGRIKYRYQEPRIVDGFIVGKCFNCFSFNHVKKDCKSLVKTCFNCGEDHHVKDCKENKPSCINCKRANEEIKSGKKFDINHSMNDFECPCYLRKYNYLMSMVK